MSEIISYITADSYIDIMQVKRYNTEEAPNWMMQFTRNGEPRLKGWVVSVRAKNNVGTAQHLRVSKHEALEYAASEYGVQL